MAEVVGLAVSGRHSFSKMPVREITLVAGEGIVGDAHRGVTVKHRSRVAKDPGQPNLRQVHLIHDELLLTLKARGFHVGPGVMGENILTKGVDLLGLATDTRLTIGGAVLRITGLRNPCKQLNDYQPGLMQAVLERDEAGHLVRLAGVMAVVEKSGRIRQGDAIGVVRPEHGFHPLKPV